MASTRTSQLSTIVKIYLSLLKAHGLLSNTKGINAFKPDKSEKLMEITITK